MRCYSEIRCNIFRGVLKKKQKINFVMRTHNPTQPNLYVKYHSKVEKNILRRVNFQENMKNRVEISSFLKKSQEIGLISGSED